MSGTLDDLVAYRLEKAKTTLEEAAILAHAGRWNACTNRLYYACFYAVSSLIVKNGFSSSKHAGVRSLFNQHYVKTAILPKDVAWVYNALFEKRQEGDYADYIVFTKEETEPLMADAERLVAHIHALVRGAGSMGE